MSQAQTLPINQGTIGNISQQVIDGRILHNALGVKSIFANWITRRIEQYDFIEDVDYTKSSAISSFPNLENVKSLNNFKQAIEYTLTLSMAKELCMELEKLSSLPICSARDSLKINPNIITTDRFIDGMCKDTKNLKRLANEFREEYWKTSWFIMNLSHMQGL